MTMIHAISKAETGEPYLDTTQFFIQYNSQFPVITLTDSMSTYGLFYRNLGDQMLFAFVEGADEYMHFTNYGEINDIQGVWTTDTMCNHYCDVMNYTYSNDTLSIQDGSQKYTPKTYVVEYLNESMLATHTADTTLGSQFFAYWIQGNEMWQFNAMDGNDMPVLFTQK